MRTCASCGRDRVPPNDHIYSNLGSSLRLCALVRGWRVFVTLGTEKKCFKCYFACVIGRFMFVVLETKKKKCLSVILHYLENTSMWGRLCETQSVKEGINNNFQEEDENTKRARDTTCSAVMWVRPCFPVIIPYIYASYWKQVILQPLCRSRL